MLTFSVAPRLATLTPNVAPLATLKAFVLLVAVETINSPPFTVAPPVKVLAPVKLQMPAPADRVRDVMTVLLLFTKVPEITPLPAPCRMNPRVKL